LTTLAMDRQLIHSGLQAAADGLMERRVEYISIMGIMAKVNGNRNLGRIHIFLKPASEFKSPLWKLSVKAIN
jgi:hypothetical protein